MLLYKYRSLDNWKFVFDIFLHKRLFAATYKSLNDPMEGYYSFASGRAVSSVYAEQIASEKDRWRLCSLTAECRSTLMWSYYAGGHSGIAIGIAKPRKKVGLLVEQVNYDNVVSLNSAEFLSPRAASIKVLSQKLSSWQHEEEYRVFSRDPFVNVNIKELILGCTIAKDDEILLRKLVSELRPDVNIRKIKKRELKADYG